MAYYYKADFLYNDEAEEDFQMIDSSEELDLNRIGNFLKDTLQVQKFKLIEVWELERIVGDIISPYQLKRKLFPIDAK